MSLAVVVQGYRAGSGSEIYIDLYDVRTGKHKQSLTDGAQLYSLLSPRGESGVYYRFRQILFSPDGLLFARIIYTGGGSRSGHDFILLDVGTGEVKTLIRGVGLPITLSNASTFAVTREGDIFRWDFAAGEFKSVPGYIYFEAKAPRAALSPDWSTVAFYNEDYDPSTNTAIRLVDVKTNSVKRTIGGAFNITSASFAPNGRPLATSGYKIRLWDSDTGELQDEIDHGCRILAYSTDGSTLATAVGESGRIDGRANIQFVVVPTKSVAMTARWQ